jgi:hypothetical protein
MKISTVLNWISGLTEPRREDVPIQQSVFNRYDNAINQSWQVGGHHMVASMMPVAAAWKPDAHDELLRQAFPQLSKPELDKLQNGSREVDMKYGAIPTTIWEVEAPKHAMTPGEKVREYMQAGMAQPQAIEKAREWAKGEAQKFVKAKGEEAKKYYQMALKETDPKLRWNHYSKALFALGEGAHTLMDNTSPMHRDFQVYDINAPFEGLHRNQAKGGIDTELEVFERLGGFAASMCEHGDGETKARIGTEDIKRNNETLRNYAREYLGEEFLKLSTEPKKVNTGNDCGRWRNQPCPK